MLVRIIGGISIIMGAFIANFVRVMHCFWGLNRRAQSYCTLAKLLKEGRLAVPRDPALAEELLTTHRLLDAKGSVMIEGKGQLRGRLGRSPDRADALSMAAGTVEPIEAQCTVGGLPLSF